jgi:hypothetical protein
MRRHLSVSLPIAIAFSVASGQGTRAQAATFNVNTTSDNATPCPASPDPTPGNCSLRGAVIAANTTPGADTITFDVDGVFALSGLTAPGENLAASGDLDITQSLTITGQGAAWTIIDGNATDRVFHIGLGTVVTISGVTIRNGNVIDDGGGISSGGTLILVDCAVSGNFAGDDGGGLHVQSGSGATVNRCAFTRNGAGDNGGAIENESNLSITNSTISGNAASGPGNRGGGIRTANGTLNVLSCTVANNQSSSDSDGVGLAVDGGTVNIKNSIFSNNTDSDDGISLRNCSGTISSQGTNLDSGNTCSFDDTGDQIHTNPLLGPLRNNGGPTKTHALARKSPARDAGNNTGAPSTDQRGFPRPQNGTVDIGAFEARRRDRRRTPI